MCLRKARRGAAPGPSGMTSDHLFPLLEGEIDSELFTRVGSLLAVARVPHVILEATKLGRLTALSKPDGGVRGIVVGDILRRLVARTMAKQFSKKAEAATAPFQHALSTKAGCECVAHILQALSDRDPEATIMSIDGIGAFDLISRNAMLEGSLRIEDGDQLLPFERCFSREPVHIFVGGRDGRHPTHLTRGGRGAGRPPHAIAVRIGAAWFPRCNSREVERQ